MILEIKKYPNTFTELFVKILGDKQMLHKNNFWKKNLEDPWNTILFRNISA